MYSVSIDWVNDKLRQASNNGYVTLAFGLRLRTPVLGATLFDTQSTPYAAQAEGRTAGNALGQSYGLLNNRAANQFMKRVRKSKYKYDIKICAMIHDAIYIIVRNKVGTIEWANRNLTECMAWQELPELQHDKVKINSELDLFHPSWGQAINLKPNDSKQVILGKCRGK